MSIGEDFPRFGLEAGRVTEKWATLEFDVAALPCRMLGLKAAMEVIGEMLIPTTRLQFNTFVARN